ncbi:MAG: metallophosphoesterase [Thermotogae bacterium]|nr:metallophosphoesterase [Thermotogota bacterium]
MLSIMCASDVEKNIRNDRKRNVDILVGCGDLSPGYMDYLMSEFRPSVGVLIHGNHDEKYYRPYYSERNLKFSNIYKGFIIINNGVINLKNFLGKDFFIAGFSGAMSYGDKPFHFSEKEVKHFYKKLSKIKYMNKKFDMIVSHHPPYMENTLPDSDEYHKPSKELGKIYRSFFPPVWLYGHLHRNYTKSDFDFEIHKNGEKSYMINSIPYKFMEYDEENKKILNVTESYGIKFTKTDISLL